MQALSFPWMCKKAPSRKTRCFFMLLSLSKGSPCPPSRSPPPRWGSGESAGYVTRCGGDGGCTLETLKLAKSSKKVPRSRRKRRQRHKTSLFCCVGKGPNKRGIVGPFPKQQNGGFAALAHAPNLLPSNEQLIYLLLYSALADCQATCAIAVSLTGEIFRVPGGQPKSHRDSGMGVFRDMEKRMFTSSENAKAFPAENSN